MEQTAQTISKKPKIKLDFKDSKYATGRRKKSIAKIWLKKGTGKIYVNGRTMDEYFTSGSHKMQITDLLKLLIKQQHMMLDVVLQEAVTLDRQEQWFTVLQKP